MFRLHDHVLHSGHFLEKGKVTDKHVTCQVNMQRRMNLSRNHTAVHLVNKILRQVLDDPHLIQKASLIHEDYFIFEYSTVATKNSTTVFEELEKRVRSHSEIDVSRTSSLLAQ